MKTKFLITAFALLLTLPAAAQMTLIAQGYECNLSDVRLPQHDGGTIAYKPCDTCDYRTNRVAPDVVWEINGQSVRLESFRKRLSYVQDRSKQTVTVQRHLEQNRIIKVSVQIRNAE